MYHVANEVKSVYKNKCSYEKERCINFGAIITHYHAPTASNDSASDDDRSPKARGARRATSPSAALTLDESYGRSGSSRKTSTEEFAPALWSPSMARTFLPRTSSVVAQNLSVAIWSIRRRSSSTDSTPLRRRATAQPRFARRRARPPRSRCRCAPLPGSGRAQTGRGSAGQLLLQVARWPRSCAPRYLVHGTVKRKPITDPRDRQSWPRVGGKRMGTRPMPAGGIAGGLVGYLASERLESSNGSERLPGRRGPRPCTRPVRFLSAGWESRSLYWTARIGAG